MARVTEEELVNEEATLVTTLFGVLHDADDITKAKLSALTSTRPKPATTTLDGVEKTGMIVGERDVTERIIKVPTNE